MIYVGLDDTDTLDTQGTNALARELVRRLGDSARDAMVVRHQLFFDPRVPYTSHNGSASILLRGDQFGPGGVHKLTDTLRHGVQSWFVHGSDPGVCVTTHVSDSVLEFGRRCQHEIITHDEARDLAGRCGCYLAGLGGTELGVIGALAAVGLAATGDDGRVVHRANWPWPDGFSGPQHVDALFARGVHEIRCVATGRQVHEGIVDVGKRLRPNRRGGQIVLFVSLAPESWPSPPFWHAVRCN